MDKYFKTNRVKVEKLSDIDMQIIEWWAQDENDNDTDLDDSDESSGVCKGCGQEECKCNFDEYCIRCFGVTRSGISITCKITGFKPFYFIKVDNSFDRVKLHHFLEFLQKSYSLKSFPNALVKEKSCLVSKKDIFGFRNGAKYRFIKLVFNNYSALMRSRYMFKNPVSIQNVTKKPTKFKLYESNFDGFMRYCHIQDIKMAGWIKLPKGKFSMTNDSASTQLEVEIDRRDVVPINELGVDIGPFLQASWDIEVYSHDYTFPDPNKKVKEKDGSITKPNEIFQIATTYKCYGDSEVLVKHLLTLKKCAEILDSNVVVEECSTEKDLIKRWVDTISNMDPDILYTYNGDSFDCMYLIERAIIYGLVSHDKKSGYVLSKLSRLQNTACIVKKETFSSSAYGDSDFTRLYIPGRLNYDLLIHYKRGMIKYPSYKLDYISNEILKEGKHAAVGVKEIFGYYEDGAPEKIKCIGEYCIQDTELLQKLVDKQLVLTNIIQLANVTYVPVGFLTTRGQSIKVYSQLLRKAREMDFLVPHTNFNEDSYPIVIKLKEENIFEDSNIGDYFQIDFGQAQKRVASARLSEIIDDNTVVALIDTELGQEYFNRKIKYKGKDFLAPRLYANDDAIDDSFTGATVLEPRCGMYTDNVAVLDFASLYPTIQISRNLCYSTFVMDPKYNNIPNVNYETIEWDDKLSMKMKQTCEGIGKSGKSKGLVCGKQAYFEIDGKFVCRIHDTMKKNRDPDEKCQQTEVHYKYTIVQPHTDEHGNVCNKGVIPSLLEELYSERKKVKKQMAVALKSGNKVLAEILDSTQLAIKVSLNSVYGFLGRNQGNLICKPLGQLTTYVGRNLIEQSKEYAEGLFMQHIKDAKLLTHKLQNNLLLDDIDRQKVLKRFRI